MNLQELVTQYLAAKKALVDARDIELPIGIKVLVAAPQYHGPGVVVGDSGCPTERVAVRIPNDNVWWYPVECVHSHPENHGSFDKVIHLGA